MKRKRLAIAAAVLILAVAGAAVAVRVILGGDRIRAAVEAQAAAAIGQPVSIGSAVPRLLPKVGLELGQISIGANREVTIESARLSTGFRALLGRRVEEAEVTVERSRIDLRWALHLLSVLADTEATPAAGPSALVIDSIGTIAFRDVTVIAGTRELLVDLDSSLTAGDRFVVTRLHGRSEGSDLVVSGELSSVATRTGTFTIDAQTLDLDGLMAFLAAATAGPAAPAKPRPGRPPSAAPAASTPLHLDIAVRAPQGRALGVAFSKLETTARVRGSGVTLEGLKLETFGGRFEGSAGFSAVEAPPAKAGVPLQRYEWQGTFANLDVPALVAFAGAPGSLTGRLAGSIALSASGVDPLEAVRQARGTARVAITDGRIPGLEIVRSVILAFGKPTGERPAGSGEAFSRLAASLAVADRRVSTSDLTLASRDFDLAGKGTLSLATHAVDFRTDVVLSEELSAQAGRDLYRLAREGQRIVLPATITGTVESPTVFIDVTAALQRALRNRAQDEVKSLFERLWKKK